ncbi:YggS family pyridoxal phosphate-dependent enzyme [Streptococcus halichoeri]|uniref:YggS family pyridoxal phosphate-dependent enzyme n=1 Tax=Streptococcus halichoeri TaxID=254785 RepID=UPI001C8EEC54|nr:YggS family pyridoxal phosphate-dependent enzyme [Streptococcus halichoeri]
MDLKTHKDVVYSQVAKAIAKADRRPNDVTIVAVTKTVDIQTTAQLIDLGVTDFAENRVDKFLAKHQALKDRPVRWHFIGSLQRRKVKEIINDIDYFHALDSVKLAKEIDKRADHPIKCFLQVNISQEESKHGFLVSEIDQALNEIAALSKIELVGLMTMAPLKASNEEINRIFLTASQLRQTLAQANRKRMPFTELSMGMSNDYPIAIKNGATYVRIGTAFFK